VHLKAGSELILVRSGAGELSSVRKVKARKDWQAPVACVLDDER
jgi:hypothetical protein